VYLGTLHLPKPVFMAPMAGITDSAYRRVLKRYDCPALITEMVSSEGLIRGGKGSLDLLKFDPQEHPIVVQIFGAKPDVMAEAARIVAEHGFDAIDINMGCPVKKVVRNGAGSALMQDPALASAVAAAVRAAVDLPLTVKLRAGWSQAQRNVVEVARALEGAGVDGLTIHPRTRSQFYSGQADWDLIAQVVKAVAIPVIGNGDLQKPADGEAMRAQTGCAGLMVGRAALGDPFLPAGLAGGPWPASPEQRIEAFCTHMDFMVAWQRSEYGAVLKMRKHLVWYARGLPGVTGLRRQLHKFERAGEMKAAFERIVSASLTDTQERADNT
jgi:tRNA-dihydrouridine synthase B